MDGISDYEHGTKVLANVRKVESVGSSKTKEISALNMATPHYVLRYKAEPFGPTISQPPADVKSKSIFGFSGRDSYNKFTSGCELALTRYPLIKAYLSNQMTAADKLLNLVIVDALGPVAEVIYAATMETVMKAHENRVKQILVSHLPRSDSEPLRTGSNSRLNNEA